MLNSTISKRERSITLPRTATKCFTRAESYSITPVSRTSHHRCSSDSIAVTESRVSSVRAPDRFVPIRDHNRPSSEKLRTTQALNDLSPSERLVRHNHDAPDPFYFRPRALPPSPTEARKARRPSQGRTVLAANLDNQTERRAVSSSVWAVGGVAPNHGAIDNGRGGLFTSGTNAPMFNTHFPPSKPKDQEDIEKHEARLASAFQLDRSSRMLNLDRGATAADTATGKAGNSSQRKTYWQGTQLLRDDHPHKKSSKQSRELRTLPVAPFKVLDAPNLRDDYYCSILAFDSVCQTLAVGLGTRLYSWSELAGVQALEDNGMSETSWVTTLDFSSAQGKKCILAYGRSNGMLSLMSLWDAPTLYDRQYPRFRFAPHVEDAPIACMSWKPTVSMRPSLNPYSPGSLVENEDLLETYRHNWRGSVQCLAYITAHTQQICGLSWSTNGTLFATGGNDNLCFLFEAEKISSPSGGRPAASNAFRNPVATTSGQPRSIDERQAKHRWEHAAAVKAIAFCPWRDGLVATGGGSHDKCIHFYHTTSGVALATIAVHAQVTSLIWSTTRREIVATFGYAQPDHPYRIAVFSALYAIPYPQGPPDHQAAKDATGRSLSRRLDRRAREKKRNRTSMEGCIVVAASDESIKFHEVWSGGKKATVGGAGLLGGSDILEDLEGIEKEGDTIR
ncbi:hypothetical protein BD289DRAFT_459027 [Coniella lustricola]|uniref:WD40-repeat-containing domain protein n=1 Tax=Coniella lustricola TaxID=2025994 RepID=A0A2T3AGK8_9PEZI|nr:hypothetical protein BD289DRAFT_459027 [Coniella lustricola]